MICGDHWTVVHICSETQTKSTCIQGKYLYWPISENDWWSWRVPIGMGTGHESSTGCKFPESGLALSSFATDVPGFNAARWEAFDPALFSTFLPGLFTVYRNEQTRNGDVKILNIQHKIGINAQKIFKLWIENSSRPEEKHRDMHTTKVGWFLGGVTAFFAGVLAASAVRIGITHWILHLWEERGGKCST